MIPNIISNHFQKGSAMRKHRIFLVAAALLFAGCSILGIKAPQVREATGMVTVNYTYSRISGPGSNQFAIWIEDESGKLIRTLFVTDYTGRRQGWKVRPQCLTTWMALADVKNAPQESIDAVSGATPQPGNLSAVWDLKDDAGNPVAPGDYVYRIEGNLQMENMVFWTGKIHVGGARQTSNAVVSYAPESAEKLGRTLISTVSAVYEPIQ